MQPRVVRLHARIERVVVQRRLRCTGPALSRVADGFPTAPLAKDVLPRRARGPAGCAAAVKLCCARAEAEDVLAGVVGGVGLVLEAELAALGSDVVLEGGQAAQLQNVLAVLILGEVGWLADCVAMLAGVLVNGQDAVPALVEHKRICRAHLLGKGDGACAIRAVHARRALPGVQKRSTGARLGHVLPFGTGHTGGAECRVVCGLVDLQALAHNVLAPFAACSAWGARLLRPGIQIVVPRAHCRQVHVHVIAVAGRHALGAPDPCLVAQAVALA